MEGSSKTKSLFIIFEKVVMDVEEGCSMLSEASKKQRKNTLTKPYS